MKPLEVKDDSKSDTKKWKSKAEKMGAKLAGQPKVAVLISLENKETQGTVVEEIVNGKRVVKVTGAVATFIINGWTTYVPKGIRVRVPEQIAEMLGQSESDTAEAGSNIAIDRADTEHPETPYQSVRDAL